MYDLKSIRKFEELIFKTNLVLVYQLLLGRVLEFQSALVCLRKLNYNIVLLIFLVN